MNYKSSRFRDPDRAGVFQLAGAPETVAGCAEDAGLAVFRVNLQNVYAKDALISRIARTLRFPPWFGQNWDALNDSLADLSWVPGDGWLIILENADDFAHHDPGVFRSAVEVFLAVSDYWRQAGKPFWVLLHGPQEWTSGLQALN